MIEKINLFFIKEGVYLIIFILVICLVFVIYNRYKIKNPSSKSIDLTVILDGLSKDNNKKSDNRKYVNELLGKDNSSTLNKLKKRELIDLFSIKTNIEIYFNSQKDLDSDTLKYMGFVIVYIAGMLSSVFAGIYSGIVSNLVSEIIKNNNPLDFKSDLDAKIGDIYYDVFKKVKNIVTLDSVLLPIITSVIIFFSLVMLFKISKFFKGKYYNKNNLLLDLVNYAIEFRKEKEMMENKKAPVNNTSAENKAKQDKRNAKLDKQLERFYLDNVSQETKESLRYATSLFVSAGSSLSDLFLPSKHVDTRNNELLRAITTQNYILIKQNDNIEKQNEKIISILEDISNKLDR